MFHRVSSTVLERMGGLGGVAIRLGEHSVCRFRSLYAIAPRNLDRARQMARNVWLYTSWWFG